MIQGMGGIMDLTGDPEGEPQKIGVAYVDIFTGVYATVAILAALRDRDIRGRGSLIDMSLLDCQVGVDRKSVVSGKRVYVRVDLGGRRILQKKHKKSSSM